MLPDSIPTFLLHALGKPSRKIAIASGPVHVGRDPGSQLVLGDDTVSRDHAVFAADRQGNWTVACVSETNPIVVDGKLVSKSKPMHEGSEILVGRCHLIIFSLSARKAAGYLGEQKPLEITRDRDAALRLFGLTFGGSVRVAWSGARFVATSTVFFPGMKINGVRTKSAPLAPDDVIEIGSNRFRFVTEEGAIAALLR